MPRIALIVAYKGKNYHGWQYQNETTPTIQRELTSAISKVSDETVILRAAGRTDSGVHATKQVVHFDTRAIRPDKAWVLGANVQLQADVSVEWAAKVSKDFDARRSALSRRYLYLIQNTKAAQVLLGENDFSSFRAASCQAISPMRNVLHIEVKRMGDLVVIDMAANAFLHRMVRNIVGALVEVGAGEKPIHWVGELLSLSDRSAGPRTASPRGLALINVVYPPEFGVPAKAGLPNFYQMVDIASL